MAVIYHCTCSKCKARQQFDMSEDFELKCSVCGTNRMEGGWKYYINEYSRFSTPQSLKESNDPGRPSYKKQAILNTKKDYEAIADMMSCGKFNLS